MEVEASAVDDDDDEGAEEEEEEEDDSAVEDEDDEEDETPVLLLLLLEDGKSISACVVIPALYPKAFATLGHSALVHAEFNTLVMPPAEAFAMMEDAACMAHTPRPKVET